MSVRTSLVVAVIITVCGVGSIALAALGGHSALGDYTWPANAVIWCWCWYGANRANRRFTGGAS
jgi:hypothetical protein